MTLLAEHVPENRRKLVGLEGEAHIAGPLEDKILGLADFGDAREVSLDIGCEYRDTCPRKSLGHHLQRDSFSGSGSTGDEAMAICKPKRQPGWLFTPSDENFLVGIGHLVVGRSHCTASSCVKGLNRPSAIIILHLASRLNPVNGIWGSETRFIETRSTGFVLSRDESRNEPRGPAAICGEFRSRDCVAATLVTRSKTK